MRNTFEIHEKYSWTLNKEIIREQYPNNYSDTEMRTLSSSTISICVHHRRQHHRLQNHHLQCHRRRHHCCNRASPSLWLDLTKTWCIEDPSWGREARMKIGRGSRSTDGLLSKHCFSTFGFRLKSFLRRHDHLHWDLVKEMMITVEQPPAHLLLQLEALLPLRLHPGLKSRSSQ